MIVRGFPDLMFIFTSCINIMLMYIFMIVHWMLPVIGWIAVAVVRFAVVVVRVVVAGLMMVVCMFVVSSRVGLFVILKTKTCFLVVVWIIKNTFSNLKPSEENKKKY